MERKMRKHEHGACSWGLIRKPQRGEAGSLAVVILPVFDTWSMSVLGTAWF